MSQLVEELKNEHEWLVARVNEIRRHPTGANVPAQLATVKKGLLAHLRKEDDKLYPVLKKAGERDAKAREVYEVFGNEMKKISAAAVGFFEKYASTIGPDFAKDLEGLYKVLEGRIASEEMSLYATYDRVVATDRVAASAALPDDMPDMAAQPSAAAAMAYWAGGIAVLAALSVAFYKAML